MPPCNVAAQQGGDPNVGKQMELLKKITVAKPAIAQGALGLQCYLAQQLTASRQAGGRGVVTPAESAI